jgi:diacylglycerol kinase family enzyme
VLARFGLFSDLKKHAHLDNPAIRYFQTARISYEYGVEMPAHLDGEMVFAREFSIDLLPGAMRAIIDPRGGHYFRV